MGAEGQDLRFVRRAARDAGTRVAHPSLSFGAAPSPRCALRPPFFGLEA